MDSVHCCVLLHVKLVDFTLTNIGEIMEIPGINDLLKKAVTDQISQLLVLPNKFSHRLIESVSAHTLKYSLPCGVLRIQVGGILITIVIPTTTNNDIDNNVNRELP